MALTRLEMTLALIEGWIDHVISQVAAERIPAFSALIENSRRRRATNAPMQQLFANLLGLEVSPRKMREASAFWSEVKTLRGSDGRDKCWEDPAFLPMPDDLADVKGFLNSVTITNAGLNYTSPPTIQISGLGFAILRASLIQGFGGNIVLDYDFVPTTIYKYTWDLESPIELNENGLLQVVHREFFNVPTNDKGKLIVMRLQDISTKSIVNTKNTSENGDFNGGIVVDIGLENRLLPNEIVLEINPQTINRITLTLNHDISGTAGFHSVIEFLVILKVVEKEPSVIEYGTLNNINFLQ